jgi:hypothetical protein
LAWRAKRIIARTKTAKGIPKSSSEDSARSFRVAKLYAITIRTVNALSPRPTETAVMANAFTFPLIRRAAPSASAIITGREASKSRYGVLGIFTVVTLKG